jgi:hypothetical protein
LNVIDELFQQHKLQAADEKLLYRNERQKSYLLESFFSSLAKQYFIEGRWREGVETVQKIEDKCSEVDALVFALWKATPDQRRERVYAETYKKVMTISEDCDPECKAQVLATAALLQASAGELKNARQLANELAVLIEKLERPINPYFGCLDSEPLIEFARLAKKVGVETKVRQAIVHSENWLNAKRQDGLDGIEESGMLSTLGHAWTLLGSESDVIRLYREQNGLLFEVKRLAVLRGYFRASLGQSKLGDLLHKIDEFDKTLLALKAKLLLLKEYLKSNKINISPMSG